MSDFEKMISLLELNEMVDFRSTKIYGEDDSWGYAIWFDNGGHLEFDSDGNLTNIVDY
jgi:hypothetical protein